MSKESSIPDPNQVDVDAYPPMLHQIPECDPITTAEIVGAAVFSDIPGTT